MDILEEMEGNVLILTPEGRIDSVSSSKLEIKILQCIDDGQTQIVIDLAKVNFVSSAGLRVFLMTAKKLKPKGGQAILCNIAPEVREVFEVSGFSGMFSIQHSVRDAVALF